MTVDFKRKQKKNLSNELRKRKMIKQNRENHMKYVKKKCIISEKEK